MTKVKIAGDKVGGVGRIDRQRITGLASLAASTDVWLDIEREWERVLDEHGRKRSHMADDHSDDDSFTEDRLRVVQQFINDKERVCTAISAVRLCDYEWAVQEARKHPNTLPMPRHTCLNTYWCLYRICERFPKGNIDIVFDQNEPFLHEVDRLLRRKSFARRHAVLSRIPSVTKVVTTCRSMEVADFLAWEINRQRTDLPWQEAGTMEAAMRQLPRYDPSRDDDYKPHPEGLRLLMTTKNKLWVREDFEYFLECSQGRHGEHGKKVVEPYSLCLEK
jgi:hypothetical protein